MQIIHHLQIDLARRMPIPPIGAVQNDSNTRCVAIDLLENGVPWKVPEGVTAAVAFRKSDGNNGLYDTLPNEKEAITVKENTATAILAPQVLTCPGTVLASVVFYDKDVDTLATFPFRILVEENPAAGEQISNNYYALQNLDQVNQAYNDLVERVEFLEESGGSATLEQLTEAVNAYLDEHPVEVSGVVKKINGVAPDENGNVEITVSDSSQKPTIETFTTQPIGQLFDPPADYTFWSPQTLVYDPNIKKYVDLLFCTTYHLADDSAHTLWVTYIDPVTYEASDPVQCVYMDGETVLTPPDAGCAAFIILDDGRYMQINRPTSNSTDMYLFYSDDHGKTWVKGELASGFDTTWEVYYLVRLSNGRLLANSTGVKYIYYSDDDGKNWSKVQPTTCGGNMESEINFFEVKAGVVIAIGRYSMSGMGVNESGDCQHAIISYSEDYGTTWTPWKLSETIDNMNASCCSGYLHDGVLELFVGSRWYHYGANATTDYINTGKSGAIMHYTATVGNALADNFTNLGVVVYSKAIGELSAQDFHTPCVAVNGKEMLMVYCDRVPPYTTADKANHYYVRGSLNGIDFGVKDDLESKIFPMSSAKVNALINRTKNELIVKINEAILSGEIIPPVPDDEGNPGSYVFNGIICNFNYLDKTKYNSENVTLTDSINGVVGTFVAGGTSANISRQTTPDTLPEIRDNSASMSTLYIPANALSQFVGDNGTEITIEISQYRYTGDTMLSSTAAQYFTNSGGGTASIMKQNGTTVLYTTTSGTSAVKNNSYLYLMPNAEVGVLIHAVLVVGSDGIVKLYKDGKEVVSESIGEDFASLASGNFTQNQYFRGHMKAVRIYNRALTAEEVATNYAYEKATLV